MLALAAAPTLAQSYPARSVRVIVPFSAGGGTDFIGRTVTQRLSELWRQPVVVDNRPGGTTVIGSDIVAKSVPDGYTLLVTPVPFSIIPSFFAKLPFDPISDFEPIALFNTAPLVMVVNPVVPARSVKDLIGIAKSKPGILNFGSSGNGSSNHLAGELFNTMAGVRMVHVPYKGSAQVLTDLVGGHVDVAITTLTSSVALIKSGKLRPLAITSLERFPAMPAIPTLHESGLKGFQAVAWNGLSAPARTPKHIIEKINADVVKVVQSPEVVERFRNEGAIAAIGTADDFKSFVRSEIAKWRKVIQAAGIKPN
ncbi:MAG: tripartite tricarboxylate transporter substrate binding protein [Betaproteobacteria bacterium]|nr:tripartite tricarboxylate transporter substrate binding protein [Betaproteobacteria bacterium]